MTTASQTLAWAALVALEPRLADLLREARQRDLAVLREQEAALAVKAEPATP